MVESTAAVQYRHWREKTMPPVERVRDGLWSIPVPMFGTYLLAYALELPDGLALVDTGWPSEEAWRSLVEGLAVIGYQPRHVRAVLATHVHTDHYGLAGRLREESGAWLALHPADAAWGMGVAPNTVPDWPERRVRLGCPPPGGQDYDGGLRDSEAGQEWRWVYRTRPDVLIEDGELLDLPGWRLRAVWTPGHSPGQVCLHAEDLGLLLAGDHVLPKVTPHVGVSPMQRADPVGDFLGSLTAVRTLDVAEVLPGHEYRYTGLRERADELIAHHEARLTEVEERLAASPGSTCWEVTRSLSWSRPLETQPPQQSRKAAQETYAHLIHLAARDRVEATGDQPQRWWIRAC